MESGKRTIVYKILIIILTFFLLFVLINYFLKYKKTNTNYQIITVQSVHPTLYRDYSLNVVKDHQEFLDFENKSKAIKEVFHDLKIEEKPVIEYFNANFFENNNVIVILSTIEMTSDNIIIVKENNFGEVYTSGAGIGAVVHKGYVNFIVIDKDIKDISYEGEYSKNYELLKLLYVGISLIALIGILFLKLKNKINNILAGVGIVIALYFIAIPLFAEFFVEV